MFSFFRKKDFLKKAAFMSLFLVLLTSALFISCSDDPPRVVYNNVPTALQNTWLSEYDEEFIITATDFTYSYDGDTVYAGTIANYRADGNNAGYITIQYTEAVYQSPDSIGNYYVIHYKDLTATTMSIAGASNSSYEGGEGKATIAEAEATFTVAGGYFTYYSDVWNSEYSGGPDFTVPAALIGTWVSEYGEDFIITATDFSYEWGGDVVYAGPIVNHRADGGDTAGYITIQYTEAAYQPADSIGNYYVIHYKDLTATTVSISGASNSSYEGGEGKATIAEAEETFTVEGGYFPLYSDCDIES